MHRLFDPLIEAASALGAGLDWKTSLQELAAEHTLGVPEYVIEDEGPDHMKTFTAQVRVADQLYGNGIGRSKKEAEQAAAETAYGEIAARLGVVDPIDQAVEVAADDGRPLAAGLTPPCPSCPRSRWSAPAWPSTSLGATITAVEVLHPRPVRRDPRGPAGFAAALTGRRIEAARRRGKYLWLPLDNGDALLGHLGMSGQLLVQPPDVGAGAAPAGPARARRARPRAGSCASSTSGCSAACRSRPAAPSCRPRSPTSPATRSTRSSTTTRSWRRCGGAARASSASCSTRT